MQVYIVNSSKDTIRSGTVYELPNSTAMDSNIGEGVWDVDIYIY